MMKDDAPQLEADGQTPARQEAKEILDKVINFISTHQDSEFAQQVIAYAHAGYKEKGLTGEVLGKENGAYKIKMKTKDNAETTYFIDSASYHITKTITIGSFQGQQVEVSTAMSDYQKTDIGYVIPHNITIDMGGFAFTLLIKKVEMNKPIDLKLFDMPK